MTDPSSKTSRDGFVDFGEIDRHGYDRRLALEAPLTRTRPDDADTNVWLMAAVWTVMFLGWALLVDGEWRTAGHDIVVVIVFALAVRLAWRLRRWHQ